MSKFKNKKSRNNKKKPSLGPNASLSDEKKPKSNEFSLFPISSWSFQMLDMDGPFGWKKVDDYSQTHKILERLKESEGKSQQELMKGGSHFIKIEKLSLNAQERINALNYDDYERLFSLRLGGRERIFCLQRRGRMNVLWWDPDHQVCPAHKKHT